MANLHNPLNLLSCREEEKIIILLLFLAFLTPGKLRTLLDFNNIFYALHVYGTTLLSKYLTGELNSE